MDSSDQDEWNGVKYFPKRSRKVKFDRRVNNDFIFNALKKINIINDSRLSFTWSLFLNVLDLRSRVLPDNMMLILKIHRSNSLSSEDSYHVVCDEDQFKDFLKLTRDKSRGLTIFIHLSKRDSPKISDQELLKSIMEPNTVHFCFYIPPTCYSEENSQDEPAIIKQAALQPLSINFMKICANNLCDAIRSFENMVVNSKFQNFSHDSCCNFCENPITGLKYTCTKCEGYLLCQSCFDMSDAIHGSDHDSFLVDRKGLRVPNGATTERAVYSEITESSDAESLQNHSNDNLKFSENKPALSNNFLSKISELSLKDLDPHYSSCDYSSVKKVSFEVKDVNYESFSQDENGSGGSEKSSKDICEDSSSFMTGQKLIFFNSFSAQSSENKELTLEKIQESVSDSKFIHTSSSSTCPDSSLSDKNQQCVTLSNSSFNKDAIKKPPSSNLKPPLVPDISPNSIAKINLQSKKSLNFPFSSKKIRVLQNPDKVQTTCSSRIKSSSSAKLESISSNPGSLTKKGPQISSNHECQFISKASSSKHGLNLDARESVVFHRLARFCEEERQKKKKRSKKKK